MLGNWSTPRALLKVYAQPDLEVHGRLLRGCSSALAIARNGNTPARSAVSNGDHDIRVVTLDGAPWFVAADVCRALGYATRTNGAPNVTRATSHLAADEKGVHRVNTPGGPQPTVTVSEPGLYELIARSDKPEAKTFRRWVNHVVLPAIRKDGAYVMGEAEHPRMRASCGRSSRAGSCPRTLKPAQGDRRDQGSARPPEYSEQRCERP